MDKKLIGADHDYEINCRAILEGTRKLVGWGASAFLHYHLIKCPYPLAYLIDNDPDKWGTQYCGIEIRSPSNLECEPPDSVLIISFIPLDLICKQIEAIGPFAITIPFQIEKDGPLLRRLLISRPLQEWPTWTQTLMKTVKEGARRERRMALRSAYRAALSRGATQAVRRRASLMFFCLHPGGADRQICNLAVGLREHGWDVELVSYAAPMPGTEHYVRLLEEAGVSFRILPNPRETGQMQIDERDHNEQFNLVIQFVRHLPPEIMFYVLAAYHYFVRQRPELIVSYLDYQNIIASLGGLLAGVPNILLSGRNLHPGNFPHYYSTGTEWIRHYYRLVLRFPNVTMSSNSAAGAISYAEWLRVAPDSVRVINNGILFDRKRMVAAGDVERARTELGAQADTPLVVGVFRLAIEKNPQTFVDVVAQAKRKFPNLKAAIVGEGPMRESTERYIADLGLQGTIKLTGVRDNVAPYMLAGDVILHVAEAEGIPNALLEAQMLGRPIVCTLGGGTSESLASSLMTYAREVGDVEGLTRALCDLLGDRKQALSVGHSAFVETSTRFSIEALVTNTLAARGLES